MNSAPVSVVPSCELGPVSVVPLCELGPIIQEYLFAMTFKIKCTQEFDFVKLVMFHFGIYTVH